MSTPAARARLTLTALDDRLAPSAVTATYTARPLDFTAAGTLTTADPVAGAAVATTNTVNVTGRIDYTKADAGTSGTVQLTGTGTGTVGADAAAPPFSQLVRAQFAFADAGDTVTVTNPLTGTATWQTDAANGDRPVGPLDGSGAFDPSSYQLTASLTGAGGATGALAVTLTDKTTQATDLAFTASSAIKTADGTVGADFTAVVSGKLMTAASHTAAAAHVTGYWGDGAGRTEATDFDVPVYWNSGRVVGSVRGLTPPAWATTFTLSLDKADAVAEADETNNTWTVALGTLPTAPPPSSGGSDGGTSTPPPAGGSTGGPIVAPVGYTVMPYADVSALQWRDATGRVVHAEVAFGGFDGDVSVAVGDVNHDGVLDAAVGAGVGGGPRVRVFDGATGKVLLDAFVYEASFRGGVNVALGDVDGDGKDELVVGSGPGGGPRVRVIDVADGFVRYDFLAYEPAARGGVSVAAADLDGDGKAEIVTGPGAGGGPVIALFNGADGAELQRVMAGPAGDRGGARLSVTKGADGKFLVTAESETGGALKRFKQQLSAAGPELTELPDALAFPVNLYGYPAGTRV